MAQSSQKWRENSNKSSSWWIKFFLGLVFLAFAILAYALFKETYKKYQIQKEVDELKHQAEELDQGNQKLRGLVDYFKTQNFSEKEARGKLNVKKEGETMVILKSQENQGEETKTAKQKIEEEQRVANIPNPLRWWSYFFNDKSTLRSP